MLYASEEVVMKNIYVAVTALFFGVGIVHFLICKIQEKRKIEKSVEYWRNYYFLRKSCIVGIAIGAVEKDLLAGSFFITASEMENVATLMQALLEKNSSCSVRGGLFQRFFESMLDLEDCFEFCPRRESDLEDWELNVRQCIQKLEETVKEHSYLCLNTRFLQGS